MIRTPMGCSAWAAKNLQYSCEQAEERAFTWSHSHPRNAESVDACPERLWCFWQDTNAGSALLLYLNSVVMPVCVNASTIFETCPLVPGFMQNNRTQLHVWLADCIKHMSSMQPCQVKQWCIQSSHGLTCLLGRAMKHKECCKSDGSC